MIPPGGKAATAGTAVLNSVGSTAVSRLNLLARLNPWLNLLAMPIFLAMLIFSPG